MNEKVREVLRDPTTDSLLGWLVHESRLTGYRMLLDRSSSFPIYKNGCMAFIDETDIKNLASKIGCRSKKNTCGGKQYFLVFSDEEGDTTINISLDEPLTPVNRMYISVISSGYVQFIYDFSKRSFDSDLLYVHEEYIHMEERSILNRTLSFLKKNEAHIHEFMTFVIVRGYFLAIQSMEERKQLFYEDIKKKITS